MQAIPYFERNYSKRNTSPASRCDIPYLLDSTRATALSHEATTMDLPEIFYDRPKSYAYNTECKEEKYSLLGSFLSPVSLFVLELCSGYASPTQWIWRSAKLQAKSRNWGRSQLINWSSIQANVSYRLFTNETASTRQHSPSLSFSVLIANRKKTKPNVWIENSDLTCIAQNRIWDIGLKRLKHTFSQPGCKVLHMKRDCSSP